MKRFGASVEILGIFTIFAVLVFWLVVGIEHVNKIREERARVLLPETSDFFRVTYATLVRKDGKLAVFSDGRATESFEGRYRVTLRNQTTLRHIFTPEWSGWLDYVASDHSGYRQPETLGWWANREFLDQYISNGLVKETCWQARIEDEVLGLVELKPTCITSVLEREK